MIVRARTVVTMDGPPIENGAVAVSGNRIVDVGRFDDIKTRNAGNTVDLGEQVLLPGLINAHCHLDYTCLRGKNLSQSGFAQLTRKRQPSRRKIISRQLTKVSLKPSDSARPRLQILQRF